MEKKITKTRTKKTEAIVNTEAVKPVATAAIETATAETKPTRVLSKEEIKVMVDTLIETNPKKFNLKNVYKFSELLINMHQLDFGNGLIQYKLNVSTPISYAFRLISDYTADLKGYVKNGIRQKFGAEPIAWIGINFMGNRSRVTLTIPEGTIEAEVARLKAEYAAKVQAVQDVQLENLAKKFSTHAA